MRVIAPEESHLDYLFLLGFLLISTVGNHPPIKVAFVVILLFFSFYLRKKDQRTTDLEKKYIVSKDTHWEKQQELSEQNKALALSQETQLALQLWKNGTELPETSMTMSVICCQVRFYKLVRLK